VRPFEGVHLTAHIDGGARGNPGDAGYGVHLTGPDGEILDEVYGFLGVRTNNVAEYAALIAALEYAVRAEAGALTVWSDSELLVRQIRGQYRVKNAGLQPLHARARQQIARLAAFEIGHVRRERNREADGLANQAMDERNGSGHFTPGEILGGPLP
jgi:probable phosphoglycerate mutase